MSTYYRNEKKKRPQPERELDKALLPEISQSMLIQK